MKLCYSNILRAYKCSGLPCFLKPDLSLYLAVLWMFHPCMISQFEKHWWQHNQLAMGNFFFSWQGTVVLILRSSALTKLSLAAKLLPLSWRQ